ncbi:MAG: hypothetical protein OQL28_01470 [Sedimenticola sp.]|nr:hypothetical protein [Sedimenticola sp.]
MPEEPRAVFLLVRRYEDLKRVGEELTAYLSILRRQSPDSALDLIHGIWIDEENVANLPKMLSLPNTDGGVRTVRVLETTGVNGVWMLCWLEVAAKTISRSDLVVALLEYFGVDETAITAIPSHFIPVFTRGTTRRDADGEMRTLEVRYPGLVQSPYCLGDDLLIPLDQMDARGEVP